jgi:hypothetical protein
MQAAVAEVRPRPVRINVYRRESGRCRAVHPMPTADLPVCDLTGDSISPTGLTASAAPGIGSARTHHRTCA